MRTKLKENRKTECCDVGTERAFTAEKYIPGRRNCKKCGNFIETNPKQPQERIIHLPCPEGCPIEETHCHTKLASPKKKEPIQEEIITEDMVQEAAEKSNKDQRETVAKVTQGSYEN